MVVMRAIVSKMDDAGQQIRQLKGSRSLKTVWIRYWAGGLMLALAGLAHAQGVSASGPVAPADAAPPTSVPQPQAGMQPPMAQPVSVVPLPANTAPRGSPASQAAGAAAAEAAVANSSMASLAGLRSDYTIGPNDLIDVEVYGVPDLKRSVRVNAMGLVSLPLVGAVELGGLTAQQAEKKLAATYGEKYLQNPQISIFIREFTTQRVIVEGAVGRPGIYPFTGKLTLLRIMAMVGGGASMAELEQIMVYRNSPDGKLVTLTFDLNKVRDGEVPDPPIVTEDVIVVKRNAVRAGIRDSLFRDIIDTINPLNYIRP